MKTKTEILQEIKNLEYQKEIQGLYIPKFVRLQINNRIKILKWVLGNTKLKQIGKPKQSTAYNELSKIKIEDL